VPRGTDTQEQPNAAELTSLRCGDSPNCRRRRAGTLLAVSLEKWKKNAVFEAIQKTGLRPEEFGWKEEGGVDRLTHTASEAFFSFGGVSGQYRVGYVARDAPVVELPKYTWDGVMASVAVWLWQLKSDLDMPDLWARLRRQPEMLGPAPHETIENSPFAAGEQAEIRHQLREIQEYVEKSYALSESQLHALEETRAYMEEAVSRLGRIDWRNAAAGAMLGALVTAAIPSDAVRAYLEMLFQNLAHLFTHGGLLLG
jgi:hypothetical protein